MIVDIMEGGIKAERDMEYVDIIMEIYMKETGKIIVRME